MSRVLHPCRFAPMPSCRGVLETGEVAKIQGPLSSADDDPQGDDTAVRVGLMMLESLGATNADVRTVLTPPVDPSPKQRPGSCARSLVPRQGLQKGSRMKKRSSAEQIVGMLRQADVDLGQA